MRYLRVAAPLVASAVLLLALSTCLAFTLARGRYVGGLKLPYFSDIGRDTPSYYVFGVGLTIVALAILLTWVLNVLYQVRSLRLRSHHGLVPQRMFIWSALAAVVGVLSTPGLPVLSFCSTSVCPNVHTYATNWFFLLETLAIVVNTCVMVKLLHVVTRDASADSLSSDPSSISSIHAQTQQSLRATVKLQVVTAALLVLTALSFTGIGIALAGPTPRLTVQECLAKQLGTHYCTVTMHARGDATNLWRYETKFGLHQARAVCEWVAMLALVGYSLSFLLYRDHEVDAHARRALDAPLLDV